MYTIPKLRTSRGPVAQVMHLHVVGITHHSEWFSIHVWACLGWYVGVIITLLYAGSDDWTGVCHLENVTDC